ncbi:Mov34/MPN/PAD-1 family protein [Nostoc spongiaeforme FACHB-130]|uniref:Mov34/MPN/PAD-1 family protein n=1 Tax=Nostoc spongiaeforme FACHB-130 TaxID=1357510 RepID=A0ABR8G4W8_9NOSO|nr:ThiF family adenylyltransferase [Nostoc spongiaeforme]MBD2598194.1 Mov34/MPN/PAD-1 family protein [Nostoc spongiaeforme FACHB-130]
MSNEYIDFGEPIAQISEATLTIPISHRVFRSCSTHKFFELIELRCIVREGQRIAEMLVVDCTNDGVPTKNEIGILYRERIGLIFYSEEAKMPEVRALRQNFPATPHQNHVNKGEPASLCLYFEPWEVIERSWTPQSHLNRVLWWLAETAKGTLHHEDQPVEQFYFRSPFEIILPPDFDEKIQQNDLFLTVKRVEDRVLLGYFLQTSQEKNVQLGLTCIVLALQPVTHGAVEHFPYDLGTLDGQFAARGATLFNLLCAEIERIVGWEGVSKIAESQTLLILQIPIQRNDSTNVERSEYKAFYINVNLGQLGEVCGVLTDGRDGKYYKIPSLVEIASSFDDWRSIDIGPIEVTFSLTNAAARQASGITTDTAEFSGVLAGVGALGSVLADIWYRQAWGTWTFVDPDYIKPHNLARHTTKYFQVGQFKANAVKQMVEEIYFHGYAKAFAIVDSVTNWSNVQLKTSVETADIVIDATTTLAVPRELAIAQLKRAASVFLTPSGYGSVLLLEDSKRDIRIDGLEAQYYGAILNNAWGEQHLNGHKGHLWVGAGCRDVSTVIPTDLLQLHAATLARQVRLTREQSDAAILIWHVEPQLGIISADTVSVAVPLTTLVDNWKIVWNVNLQEKVKQFRSVNLPNETGGVLLGYIDQKLQSIFVVDILPAPPDSLADSSGFTRGIQKLKEQIQSAQTRTANIVSYIGEWHSHPPGISTKPSSHDIRLLNYLVETLKHEGVPAVMLIVGENQETWSIGKEYNR